MIKIYCYALLLCLGISILTNQTQLNYINNLSNHVVAYLLLPIYVPYRFIKYVVLNFDLIIDQFLNLLHRIKIFIHYKIINFIKFVKSWITYIIDIYIVFIRPIIIYNFNRLINKLHILWCDILNHLWFLNLKILTQLRLIYNIIYDLLITIYNNMVDKVLTLYNIIWIEINKLFILIHNNIINCFNHIVNI